MRFQHGGDLALSGLEILVRAGQAFCIAAVLLGWALYAFSAAKVIGPLPLTGWALSAISLVLLARAFAFPLLRPAFPENSVTFWWVSSGICLVLGALYGAGAVAAWQAP